MHERIRDKLLGGWGHFVAAHPLVTIAVCLALAVGSVYLTVTRLELRSDRSQLIGPEVPWNQQYTQYKADFPRNDDVLVVLDGPAGDTEINNLARLIADRLAADPRVAAADAGFDLATVSPRFALLGTAEQFQTTLGELRDGRRVIAADNANAALGVLLGGLADEGRRDPGALDKLDAFIAPYLAAARGDEVDFDFLVPSRSRWQPLASHSGLGNLRYVRVSLADEDEGVNAVGATLPWLRETVRRTVTESGIRPRGWGVTGIAAIEADETTEAIRDSTAASLLAIALITLVMFLAFRGLAVPLLAALALLIGMAWAFGWLILSVGHLQLLSVVFSVILLGLGIDFALLFVSRLELVQDEHKSLASATARVYRRMGPGMVTGAVTTAAAFASVALTEFKGMAEMGTIAAGGILLCLIAVLSAFPAMLALTGRWKSIIRHRPGGETAHFASGRLDAVDGHPVITLAIAAAVVVCLGVLSLRVRYDPNVLNLQSDGVESVQWERRIVEDDERSAWAAVVRADAVTAEDLVERLRSSPEVADVGGMGMIYPAGLDARVEALRFLRDEQLAAPAADPGSAGMLSQLAAVRAGIALQARVLTDTPPEITSRLDEVSGSIRDALAASRAMAPAAREAAWRGLQERFETARIELEGWLAAVLRAEPPGIDDLPDVLRSFFIGNDGSWLLLAYPRADESGRSILDPARLGTFVESIRGVLIGSNATVIGPPVQIYESSILIKRAYVKAACYAIAAILLLLCFDFGKLGDAVCAMAPVSIGFVGAFGLMGVVGVPLNFANIIVLPIIFGIGVNAGVHVVHRWRAEPYGRPAGLSGGTGRGITLTMLTTMIGFGCLLTAQHRGIQSLGFVMIMGLSVTLLACYSVLPAILRLRTPKLARPEPLPGQEEIARSLSVEEAPPAPPAREPVRSGPPG